MAIKKSSTAATAAPETVETFKRLLRTISGNTLKVFATQHAASDSAFLHRFILHFMEAADFSAEEKYAAIIHSIVSLAQLEAGGTLLLDERMKTLMEKSRNMIEARDFLDAFFITTAVIKQKNIPAEIETAWQSFTSGAYANLAGIINTDAGFDLKERIFEFLIQDFQEQSTEGFMVARESHLHALLAAATEEHQLNRVLELFSELAGKNRNQFGVTVDEYEEQHLLQTKLLVLQKLNRNKDAHHLLEANKQIQSFRLQLINECFQKNDLEQAKELIKEGKRTEERKGRMFVNTTWDELLLKIASQENDVKAIRNLALQLFITTEFDFNYYHLLRKHYDPSRWKLQVERIVTHIKKESSYAAKGIYAVAKIFIEEQQWDALLLLMQKNANLEFVELYFASIDLNS